MTDEKKQKRLGVITVNILPFYHEGNILSLFLLYFVVPSTNCIYTETLSELRGNGGTYTLRLTLPDRLV